jgi:hypothetical protein
MSVNGVNDSKINDLNPSQQTSQPVMVADGGASILLAILLGIAATAIWEGGKALWDLMTNDPNSLIEALPESAQGRMEQLSNQLSLLKHRERQNPESVAATRQEAAGVLQEMAQIYRNNRSHIEITNPKVLGAADIMVRAMETQAAKLRRNEIEIPIPATDRDLAVQPGSNQQIAQTNSTVESTQLNNSNSSLLASQSTPTTAQVFNNAFYDYFKTNPITQQTVPSALQHAGVKAYTFDQTVTNDQLQAMSDSLMQDFLQREQQLTV